MSDPILIEGPSPSNTSATIQVEHRAITLRQLITVKINIARHYEKEGWVNSGNKKLTPKTVSLYDTNKYIIKYFAGKTKDYFISCLPSIPALKNFHALSVTGGVSRVVILFTVSKKLSVI